MPEAPFQFSLSRDEVRAWLENDVIFLKAVDPHNDPVELSAGEARELANALLRYAKRVEQS